SKDVNTMGACSGGITSAALLGHYAASKQNKINSVTQLVSVLDFTLDSQVALFADDKTLESAKRRSYQAGVLEGKEMAKVFAWMRPNDLISIYWLNKVDPVNEALVFGSLSTNNCTTRLPPAFHSQLIEMFRTHPLVSADALEDCDTP